MESHNNVLGALSVLMTAAMALFPFPAAAGGHSVRLTDVTSETGIAFVHTDGSSGKRYIIETVCAGLAVFDYDNDGDEDIYFLNGAALPGKKVAAPPRNALYRNDGGFVFTDVSSEAGVGDTGHGLGVAAGDYDNDGDLDLYINNSGPNVMYRNNGDGTFTDVTARTGTGNGDKVGAGACFLDADGDGDLDLYVSNYVAFTFENHHIVRFNGYPAYVGPMDFEPTPDTFFLNKGDGTFLDESVSSGIAAHKGTGMGMTCCDCDNDGDTDVFVGNDVAGNTFFLNDGKGRFEEAGLISGLAYDYSGRAQGTMGVDSGDYNNDGLIDFFVTSYQQDLATLYKNTGDGFFEDVTQKTGAGDGSLTYVTWGLGFIDYDNDGLRDLFVACGHLHDNVEMFDNTTSYRTKNIVLRNTGKDRFDNISASCGSGLGAVHSSRGAAFSDLDGDGDLDIVILNSREKPTVIRNDSRNNHHWVRIKLRGATGNRFGVGSHVIVDTGTRSFIDEVHSGRGYQGHYGLTLHFGLGMEERIETITVKWLGGEIQTLRPATVDRVIVIDQKKGLLPADPLLK